MHSNGKERLAAEFRRYPLQLREESGRGVSREREVDKAEAA